MPKSVNRQSLIATAEADYNTQLVRVSSEAISRYQWNLEPSTGLPLPDKIGGTDESALAFLVAMSAWNYRFWEVSEGASPALTRYELGGRTGARALWRAFEQAWTPDTAVLRGMLKRQAVSTFFGDFLNTSDRASILTEVLRSDGTCLQETCSQLVADIHRRTCVSVEHAAMLASVFPLSFDEPYLKKAQLALTLYASYSKGRGVHLGNSDLTAMADYQVPRVLRAMGVLEYSPELAAKIDGWQLIPSDSAEERALRSATLLACDEIAAVSGQTAADIDNALWQGQAIAGNSRFHLTPTTRY